MNCSDELTSRLLLVDIVREKGEGSERIDGEDVGDLLSHLPARA